MTRNIREGKTRTTNAIILEARQAQEECAGSVIGNSIEEARNHAATAQLELGQGKGSTTKQRCCR